MLAAVLGEVAARAGLALAALLAWLLARPHRSPHFRPVALVLIAFAGADSARGLLRYLVLAPARAAGRVPYAALERAAFHLEQLLVLAFPVLSVVLAWRVFRRSPVPSSTWGVGVGAWAVCVLSYPVLRGDALLHVYLGAHLGSLAVQLGLGALFFLRRGVPGVSQRVALAMTCSDIAQLAGPWAAGCPLRDWYTASWPSTLVWLVVAAYEWRDLRWTARHAQRAATLAGGSPRWPGQLSASR